jgi:hypothetical protein
MKNKLIIHLLIASLICYIGHKLILILLEVQQANFYYSIETIYLFFILFSAVMLFSLIKIKEIMPENVGMVFILATTVKAAFCYLLLRPILAVSSETNAMEKKNILVVFLLCLFIDVLFTARLLNNKKED